MVHKLLLIIILQVLNLNGMLIVVLLCYFQMVWMDKVQNIVQEE